MKTPLAWLNLRHDKTRTSVAIAGVAFAVILILMQLGFYVAVRRTATRVYDHLQFDLLLVSPSYQHLAKSNTVPLERLLQAEALPEVASAQPLYISYNTWLAQHSEPRQRRGILVFGFRPHDEVFDLAEINEQKHLLNVLDKVLMDELSRPEFGPHPVGLQTEVGRRRIEVVGEFTLGTGFSADGAIITSDRTFSGLMGEWNLGNVSIGLVMLEPGSDPAAVAAQLEALLPQDVDVYTRQQMYDRERHHWVAKTSVGVIFGLGVIVAILVGVAIVYQVLSSDIANRLPEYATLKAMGYSNRYLTSVVITQAATLAVCGFLPGWLVAVLLYKITAEGAHMPMDMTWPLVASVLIMDLGMCCVSGMMALPRFTADPADLF